MPCDTSLSRMLREGKIVRLNWKARFPDGLFGSCCAKRYRLASAQRSATGQRSVLEIAISEDSTKEAVLCKKDAPQLTGGFSGCRCHNSLPPRLCVLDIEVVGV